MFGADEYEAMSTKQIQRQVALNTLQAQKIELDKQETASTLLLTKAQTRELVTKEGLSVEEFRQLKSEYGLVAVKGEGYAITRQLTKAEADALIAKIAHNEVDENRISTLLTQNGLIKEQITLSGILDKVLTFTEAHPIMAGAIAFAAVTVGVIELADALNVSAEEAQESYKEFEEVKLELESLNSELAETKSRINELNAQQNLSLVEAEELANLKEVNRQLELEIKNRETIAQQKGKEANDDAVNYFNGTDIWNGIYDTASERYLNNLESFEYMLNEIGRLKEEQATLGNDIDSDHYKMLQRQIEAYELKASNLLEDFMETDDALIEGMDDGVLQKLQEFYHSYDAMMNDIAQTNTDTIEGAFEKVEFEGLKDRLLDLEKAGTLSVGMLSTGFSAFVEVLKSAGVSAEELYQYIQHLANPDALNYSSIKDQLWASMGINTRTPGKHTYDTMSMFEDRGLLTNEALEAYISVKTKFEGKTDTWTPEDWAKHIEDELNTVEAIVDVSFSDTFALENADGEATELGKLSEQVDKLQTAWSGLREMVDNYNKTGTITVDQFQELLSYGDEYLQYIVDENGNLQLNEEALKKVAAARIENMKLQMLQELYSNLQSITNEAQAQDFLAEKLNASSEALAENTSELYKNIGAQLGWLIANEEISKDTSFAIWEYVQNYTKIIDKLGDSISVSSFNGVETDWKDLLDKETALLEKQLEAGLISFEDYANKRKAIIERYYKDGLITAEEYYSALEDMYDYQLSVYDKILNAVTRRFDKEIESIEKQIESLEKSNELLEKQKDDYDKVLSVVSEVYDKEIERIQTEQDAIQDKIDLLQEENDESKRAIELEKAKYELARLQSQRNKKVRHCLLLQ